MRALCFDLGDTIMIEETEVKDATETTQHADLIPGMPALLRDLKAQGYPLALVADSKAGTPLNVLRQHDLLDLFDALAVSEVVGVSKPDPAMFQSALQELGVEETAYPHCVMVGNNLERDIVGANRLGLISVFFHWNERRRTQPLTAEEQPDYTVHSVEELRDLLGVLVHPR
jgi:putative hydrolase of the HAD superfamily